MVDPDAIKVHGITDEMLADKPDFKTIAKDFIEYSWCRTVDSQRPFDVGFMDYEFRKLGLDIKRPIFASSLIRCQMGAKCTRKRNSLDALCDRLGIDNSKRTLHGALLDAEILADVYLFMTGGQTSYLMKIMRIVQLSKLVPICKIFKVRSIFRRI